MIRVILVDDTGEVRRVLRERLDFEPDIEVVGEAQNGQEALDLAARLRPDVIIMDVKMPLTDGITATQALKASWPQSRIVILSLYDDPVTRNRAREAGAKAFIAKQDNELELLAAIRNS